MRPILYSFRRCPYAIRARMAVYYSDQECELREVVLKNKPQAMLDISPKGTVPVLRLAGRVIDESIDVMRWALSLNDPDGWSVCELDHLLLINNDGPFKQALDKYKYFDRFPEQSQREYFEQTKIYLDALEQNLVVNANEHCFLLHPTLSAIDVAIFPFVRQLAFVDKPFFDQLNLPKLHSWLNWHLESELFVNVMTKHPAWSSEQADPILLANT